MILKILPLGFKGKGTTSSLLLKTLLVKLFN